MIESIDTYENQSNSSVGVYMDGIVFIEAEASYYISFNACGNQIVTGANRPTSSLVDVSYADAGLDYDDAYTAKSAYATYTASYAAFSALGTVEFETAVSPNDNGYDPSNPSLGPGDPDGAIPVTLLYDNVGFLNYKIFADDCNIADWGYDVDP